MFKLRQDNQTVLMFFTGISSEWKPFFHVQIISHKLQIKGHFLLVFMQVFINWRGFLIQILELSLFLPWLSYSLSHVHSFDIEFLLFCHKIDCHKLRIQLPFVQNDFLKIFVFELNMNWIFKIYFDLLRFIF